MNTKMLYLSLLFLSNGVFYAGESSKKKMKPSRFHTTHKPLSVGEKLRAIQLELEKGPEYADVEHIVQLSHGISERHMPDDLKAGILEAKRMHKSKNKRPHPTEEVKKEREEVEKEAVLEDFKKALKNITPAILLGDINVRQKAIKGLNEALKRVSNRDDCYKAFMNHLDNFIGTEGEKVLKELSNLYEKYSDLKKEGAIKIGDMLLIAKFKQEVNNAILPFAKMYVMFFSKDDTSILLALNKSKLFSIKRANSVCAKNNAHDLIYDFFTQEKMMSLDELLKAGIKTNLYIEEYSEARDFRNGVNAVIDSLDIRIECQGQNSLSPVALYCLTQAYEQVLQQGTK